MSEFYDAALANSALYWVMQVSLLGTAIWLWRALFAAAPMPGIITAVLAIAQMGMLGALLTFAPDPMYATQVHDTHFVVAHLHYVLVSGFIFPMMAGAAAQGFAVLALLGLVLPLCLGRRSMPMPPEAGR